MYSLFSLFGRICRRAAIGATATLRRGQGTEPGTTEIVSSSSSSRDGRGCGAAAVGVAVRGKGALVPSAAMATTTVKIGKDTKTTVKIGKDTKITVKVADTPTTVKIADTATVKTADTPTTYSGAIRTRRLTRHFQCADRGHKSPPDFPMARVSYENENLFLRAVWMETLQAVQDGRGEATFLDRLPWERGGGVGAVAAG